MVGHVRDSVRQANDNTWVIDQRFLLQRHRQPPEAGDYLWKDGDGWYFTIIDTPSSPLPLTTPLPPDTFPKLIYDVGDASAVFDFGEALLRVEDRHPFPGVTPEPNTLHWLAELAESGWRGCAVDTGKIMEELRRCEDGHVEFGV